MTILQANYVINNNGQKVFVQVFKDKLKKAFKEVRAIQKGEKKGTLLKDFLDEL